MSSNSGPGTSFSQFQAIFDAALDEYSQKTGNNIDADPLTSKLESCHSPDAVLDVLEGQGQAFNEFRNGDGKVQLMRKLKPIVHILLSISHGGILEVGNGIGLVSAQS